MGIQEVVEQSWDEIVAIHNAPILAEIDSLSLQIRQTKELYDSLFEFKSRVTSYQGDFYDQSTEKKAVIADMETTIKNNDAKNMYLIGITDTFVNMVDNRISTSVFDWFYNMINTKLKSYADSISNMEGLCAMKRASLW